ncbi:MAG: hypothetical protein K2O70_04730 [Desulfovibrionaceae bacterium]|nr:hypothetical protein [Desulfovibrionaceae bacterium]
MTFYKIAAERHARSGMEQHKDRACMPSRQPSDFAVGRAFSKEKCSEMPLRRKAGRFFYEYMSPFLSCPVFFMI